MYSILFEIDTEKILKHIPKRFQLQIFNKIESLANKANFESLKLVNSEFYRIKSGDYRIIFSLDESKKTSPCS
ncbi:MAG: type II toxin-antitoxin system RelE/ParE family toxin [Leptospiraceae bacterium]|nr:type II toxin-antitoxin system RelE/ParE family toxin [Leptospiraceae bacterium]MBK9499425.1 type II toxin-antitoxin system RelE/ParE family toxin [Leptospiraceae bacterium]MBL0265918.1 type II toxin-antitoxin system RelE/ParE family toxin [Leptospiraceae bacterium]MBP9164552.1 type II toxin-antitoxin system RelE/ParE family toxin [Leptospiraceae bacterium]